MNKLLFLFLCLIILITFYLKENFQIIEINSQKIVLEISNSDREKVSGLSYRKSLCDYCGMLFVYKEPAVNNFWMREMNFPLDIIWLDENKKIIYIEENLKPETFPKTFGPKGSSMYVLEFNENFVKENNMKLGDKINL